MAQCLNICTVYHPFTGAWDLFDGIGVDRLLFLLKSHPGLSRLLMQEPEDRLALGMVFRCPVWHFSEGIVV